MSKKFILETIDPNQFIIEDVLNDNACFYRAFSNCLRRFCNTNLIKSIKSKVLFNQFKDIDNLFNHIEWGYGGEEQEKLARILQKISYDWILNNINKNLEEYGESIETMVFLTHDITIDEYIDRYK